MVTKPLSAIAVSPGIMDWLSVAACAVALVFTVLVTGRSINKDASVWIYKIGDQPLYRSVALIVVVLVAHQSFTAALMLATFFMAASTTVPSLANAEPFVNHRRRAIQ